MINQKPIIKKLKTYIVDAVIVIIINFTAS